MLDVLFIRHGETMCNAEGRHTGWLNYHLNENGYAQADRAGKYLQGISFDRYYCSDIQRTRDTFEHIFGNRPDCVYDPLLREANSGELAGMLYEECAQRYGDRYWEARKHWHFKQFGGEDMDEVNERARQFMEKMAALPKDVHRVAVVSHGGLIRSCAGLVLGGEMPHLPVKVNNCSCSVLRLNNKGVWSIHCWNVQDISSQLDFLEWK